MDFDKAPSSRSRVIMMRDTRNDIEPLDPDGWLIADEELEELWSELEGSFTGILIY